LYFDDFLNLLVTISTCKSVQGGYLHTDEHVY